MTQLLFFIQNVTRSMKNKATSTSFHSETLNQLYNDFNYLQVQVFSSRRLYEKNRIFIDMKKFKLYRIITQFTTVFYEQYKCLWSICSLFMRWVVLLTSFIKDDRLSDQSFKTWLGSFRTPKLTMPAGRSVLAVTVLLVTIWLRNSSAS